MSSMFKQMIRSVIGAALLPSRKSVTRNALTVFVYHDVTDHPSEFSDSGGLNIPPDIFTWQCDFIRDNFNVVTPDDLLNGDLPEYAALITFDDGFSSFFTDAVPILEQFDLPSIIFLNMEPVKGSVFWSGLLTWLCKKEDFIRYLRGTGVEIPDDRPPYLSCSRELVDSYLDHSDVDHERLVHDYVGRFVTEDELELAAGHPLVYYGNHLFNHYVPRLMSDEDLLDSYLRNENELQRYPNSRNMFAFPFGKPDTCFTESQIELLMQNGAERIFSTYPAVNPDPTARFLNRVPMHPFNDSKPGIWFHILRRSQPWSRGWK